MPARIKGQTDPWEESKIQKQIQAFAANCFSAKEPWIHSGGRICSSINGAGKTEYRDRQTDRECETHRHQLEQVMNPNQVRTEAEDARGKAEEGRAGTLGDTGRDSVLEKTSNAQTTAAKIDRWDCVILRSCEWQRKQSAEWRGSPQNDRT